MKGYEFIRNSSIKISCKFLFIQQWLLPKQDTLCQSRAVLISSIGRLQKKKLIMLPIDYYERWFVFVIKK